MRFGKATLLTSMLLLPSLARAQVYVYALNEHGRVMLNGTKYHVLPGNFKTSGGVSNASNEQWREQRIVDGDHYALRRDGTVYLNGSREYRAVGEGQWIGLDVDAAGVIWRLDTYGRVREATTEVYDLDDESGTQLFHDMLVWGGRSHVLREDGKIYTNGTEAFDLPGDGEDEERYTSLAVDPATGDLFALRLDGMLYRATAGGSATGDFLVDLPSTQFWEEWRALGLDSTGQLWAMRVDGRVYQVDKANGAIALFVQYEGSGYYGSPPFLSFTVIDGHFIALRFDGRVFLDQQTRHVCSLSKERYRDIHATFIPPAVGPTKSFKPVVSVVRTTCYLGDDVTFPVLASDIDDATLTYNVLEIPQGATFDQGVDPPVFSWTPTEVGQFRFRLEVADSKKAYPRNFNIYVREPETNPARNTRPVIQRITRIQAFIGEEISIPVRAYDKDGDTLTYTPMDMPEGMVFDPATVTFTWTPFGCPRKLHIKLRVDDGISGKTVRRIQIRTRVPFQQVGN